MTQTTPEDFHVNKPVQEETPSRGIKKRTRRGNPTRAWIVLTLSAFITGSLGGYLVGVSSHNKMTHENLTDSATLMEEINPPEGYIVNTRFGNLGPQLIASGAFKLDEFASVYQRAGQPLTDEQRLILEIGGNSNVIFNPQNAYFLLNFFWALGLTNQNPILDTGPIMQNGRQNVVNFASTGGWTLAARSVEELYSSTPIITLTPDQQSRLEKVVIEVFRPCCDNPTHFPDCNHGMAMLGLLELLASQDSSEDELFEAAKYANAYWYPRQFLVLATYFQVKEKVEFSQADPRRVVSKNFSSISGFNNVQQWLSSNGLLPQAPGGGNSCGV